MTIAASLLSAARRRQVAVPGGAIAGLEFGPADRPLDVLFLHANGFNAQTYSELLSPLAERIHVVASDARGHGQSELPAEPGLAKGWTVFRDDLIALLESLKLGAAVLGGHSLGAVVSLMVASTRPDLVRAPSCPQYEKCPLRIE